MQKNTLDNKTISDFGVQWTKYTENTGYYSSSDCLKDIFAKLINPDDLIGSNIADIGSGTGRIVNMLLDMGASHVTALEPSKATEILQKNVESRREKVTIIRAKGDALTDEGIYDFVTSIGVIHHIVEPKPVINAAHRSLRPGGKIILWVYGKEGNFLYLLIFGTIRNLTKILPHTFVEIISFLLTFFATAYMYACSTLPLPMRSYMINHFSLLTWKQKKLTIYDQLNPAYAKYYSRDEAESLLRKSDFIDVKLAHRHGYSWTIVGTKA